MHDNSPMAHADSPAITGLFLCDLNPSFPKTRPIIADIAAIANTGKNMGTGIKLMLYQTINHGSIILITPSIKE